MRMLLLYALFFAGCACEPRLTGPQIEFSSKGEGEQNAKALWPLEVGYRGPVGFVEGVLESRYGSGLVYRVGAPDGLLTELYLKRDDGIYFAGATDVGVLDSPILLIPSTVRVGMKWVSHGAGGRPDSSAEVKRREVVSTPHGMVPQWTIESIDQGTKEVFTARWLEGFGEVGATTIFTEPIAVTAPRRNLLTLESLASEVVGWSVDPSMVRLGEGRALIIGGNPGSIGLCSYFDATGLLATPEPPRVDGPYARLTEPSCPLTSVCDVDEHGTLICTSVATGHASGMNIENGFINVGPRGESGEVIQTSLRGAGSVESNAAFTGLALLRSADGGITRLLVGSTSTDRAGIDTMPPGGTPSTIPIDNPLLLVPRVERAFAVNDLSGGTGLILLAGGVLWTTRVVGEAISAPELAGAMAGKFSVLATDTGNQVLRVTPDGQVDELKVNEGHLVLAHVADVSLQKSEVAVGAWRWKEGGAERLVLATVTAGKVIGLVMHFYRSKEFLTPPTPMSMPASLKVIAGVSSAADFGCWPPENEPASLSEWNQGRPLPWGVEKRAGSNCALISGHDLTLPGIGRYIIGNEFGLSRGLGQDPGPYAPLTGGGFVSARRVYQSGALLVGMPQFTVPLTSITTSVVPFQDLNGNGLWHQDPVLTRIAWASQQYPTPMGGPADIRFMAAGGGVVVATLAGYMRVTPEGVWTPVATPLVNGVSCSVLPDGTVCGMLKNAGPFCMAPNGPVVTNSSFRNGDNPSCGVTLPDGTFMLIAQTKAWHIGADAIAVDVGPQPVNIDEITFLTYEADGTPWGVVRTMTNQWLAVRFSVAGTEVVASITGAPMDPAEPERLNSLIIERDLVIVNPALGTLAFEPRP